MRTPTQAWYSPLVSSTFKGGSSQASLATGPDVGIRGSEGVGLSTVNSQTSENNLRLFITHFFAITMTSPLVRDGHSFLKPWLSTIPRMSCAFMVFSQSSSQVSSLPPFLPEALLGSAQPLFLRALTWHPTCSLHCGDMGYTGGGPSLFISKWE